MESFSQCLLIHWKLSGIQGVIGLSILLLACLLGKAMTYALLLPLVVVSFVGLVGILVLFFIYIPSNPLQKNIRCSSEFISISLHTLKLSVPFCYCKFKPNL